MKKKKTISLFLALALMLTTVFSLSCVVNAANSDFITPNDGDYVLLNQRVDIKYSVRYSAPNGKTYCRFTIERPNGERDEMVIYDESEAETYFYPKIEGTHKIKAECGMYYNISCSDPVITETISVKAVKKMPKTNPLKIKAKTAKVKYSKLKKKNQTLAVGKVMTFKKKGQGKITYAKASGNKKIIINKKTGKVTVKKKLKKGTYKVKVKVRAAGNSKYKPVTKTVTFKIKVR